MARTTSVLLLGGDYAERLQALYAQVVEAQQAQEKAEEQAREGGSSRTLLDAADDPMPALVAAYDALRAEAEAEAEAGRRKVSMKAIGRTTWRDLRKKHPVRTEGVEDDVKGDQMAGVNTETVEDDLVYACVTEPEFRSRDAFDEWAETLSQGEWSTLVLRAWELVNGARFDPKPLPASLTRSTEQN